MSLEQPEPALDPEYDGPYAGTPTPRWLRDAVDEHTYLMEDRVEIGKSDEYEATQLTLYVEQKPSQRAVNDLGDQLAGAMPTDRSISLNHRRERTGERHTYDVVVQ